MFKKSGIRYGQRHKQTRETDLDLKIKIANWLIKKGFKPYRDHHALFDRQTGYLKRFQNIVTKYEVKQFSIRNPDLIVWNPKNNTIFIIEVDGSVHNYNITDTNKRNDEYGKANLKYIVINLDELKLSKTTWEIFLDQTLNT